jgi:ABC-type spermidine/putrescine transport system permease subunit II
MGLVTPTALKRDAFQPRDALVTIAAYAAGTVGTLAFVAVATALVVLGWRDFRWILVAPLGTGGALAVSGLVLAIALPATFVTATFAAVCATDPSIGGLTRAALRESLEWSMGIPPVVIGAAVFFIVVAAGHTSILGAASAALIILNLPNASARLAQVFSRVPQTAREAAAAVGASPVTVFFALVRPYAGWAVASVFFTLAAQMFGETSAVTLALSALSGAQPLSATIWHFASNPSMVSIEAASCVILVLVVSVCLGLSKACARRHVEASATAR